ncbi:glutathione S-transferase N-terminal domain-containing protein [Rickettsiaceae bacterium]|nr:glutathione S-transferase N-terminal domain-containing protein [Rickettsiaceae bacterium]
MTKPLPILYSFRRCPYAMRARMALYYSSIDYTLREVDLKNKPQELIDISPKATVPVLHLQNGNVIDESLDIIYYALSYNDPENLNVETSEARQMISENDIEFTSLLRKYKYFERYPEKSQESYCIEIENLFLYKYEKMLEKKEFLLGKKSVVDIAILPFIRQFAFVDKEWFFTSKYKNLIRWLNSFIQDSSFENIIMRKL